MDDERDVLDSVVMDLEGLESLFPIEAASSAAEAHEILQEIKQQGDRIGLIICDHVMPLKNGSDLLIEIHKDSENKSIRKILLTGQAGLTDTIEAINKAKITHFISKPWDKENLLSVVKRELSNFILNSEMDPLPYLSIMEPDHINKAAQNGLMEQ